MLRILQSLTLVSISAFTGSCFIIAFVLIPFWKTMSPLEVVNWFATWSPRIGSTMLLMEGFGIIFSIFTYKHFLKHQATARLQWLISMISLSLSFIISLSFILFFLYFSALNIARAHGDLQVATVSSELKLWEYSHLLRMFFSGLALIAGLISLHETD
jgi:hypothetical protein